MFRVWRAKFRGCCSLVVKTFDSESLNDGVNSMLAVKGRWYLSLGINRGVVGRATPQIRVVRSVENSDHLSREVKGQGKLTNHDL